VLRRIRTPSRGRRSAKVVEGWPAIRTENHDADGLFPQVIRADIVELADLEMVQR
jgi:hypothetical protein